MKKILLVALLCLVALSVLIACDSGSDTDTVTTDGATTAPEVTVSAAELDAMILAIDGPTLENTAKIDEAYLIYCSLPKEEQAKVYAFEYLQSLRYNLTKAYVVKEYKDTRIPHNEILLGVYGSSVSLEDLSYITNADLDFVWSPSASPDDLAHMGLGYFASCWHVGLPYPWVSNEDEYRALLQNATLNDHPNLWGIDFVDEPSSSAFDALGIAAKVVQNEAIPDAAFFVNLFPNYAVSAQLGMGTYKQYLMAYVARIQSDIISYDHYPYNQVEVDLEELLKQYSAVAEMCRAKNRDHYAILQLHAGDWTKERSGNYTCTEQMLKFQAYSSMVYGAKCIAWACWLPLWGDSNVINADGNITPIYTNMKATNAAIKAMEPIYMRYTAMNDAVFCGSQSWQVGESFETYAKKHKVEDLGHTLISDITIPEEDAVILGRFKKNVGEGEGLMILGCDNPYYNDPVSVTVSFKATKADATIVAYVDGLATKLEPNADGFYTVVAHNADAVFVTID